MEDGANLFNDSNGNNLCPEERNIWKFDCHGYDIILSPEEQIISSHNWGRGRTFDGRLEKVILKIMLFNE